MKVNIGLSRTVAVMVSGLVVWAFPLLGEGIVVINEVHHDAQPKTERTEFVELYNAGDLPVDLSGWRLEGVGGFVFPEGTTLDSGRYFVVAEDAETLRSKHRLSLILEYPGSLDNDGELLRLLDEDGVAIDRVDFGSGFPWPTAARGTGVSMELMHPELDNDLGGSWRSSAADVVQLTSPGRVNSMFEGAVSDVPPAIRQVGHLPEQPMAGQEVVVTAKVTDIDGVGSVTLSYQSVTPGRYIRKVDESYETGWVELPMLDDGSGGDVLGGDDVYTVTMPENLQAHRRLVRYRITVEDTLANSVRVPYDDDECPNFAYFTYNGVPAWQGAKRPGVTEVETVPADVMAESLAVYHLIGDATDVTNSQYVNSSDGVRMWGTMVYDGKVYDHIQYYNRGEASTYVSGKNKWRFKFNRARDFAARDLYGMRYEGKWKTLNFNACASPWVAANRGIAGLDEAVPHRLYQLAGVLGSNTHWVQFRVVDGRSEVASDQYAGDLWGLYLAIEHLDGRFLDEHGLPDGNTYKIQGGVGDKKNQGPTQSVDASDWNAFNSTSGSLNTVSWWRTNFNLEDFYGFRAINRATGNVDLRDGSNYYMYHHPDGQWHTIPWDLDMLYPPVKHIWSGVIQADRCLDHPEIRTEFRNHCRGLLDLLFSDIDPHNGQAAQLVEELSQVINPSGVPLTMVDVDEYMWSHHPRTTSGHLGPWYVSSVWETSLGTDYFRTINTEDHEGFQESIIDYMFDTRRRGGFAVNDGIEDGYGFGYLSMEAADGDIPDQPTISYTGEAGYPIDGLRLTSGGFSDPSGAGTFGSMEWRIGQVSNPLTPDYASGDPWVYEVEDQWDSGQLSPFVAEVMVPVSALRPGGTYRARVRHWDDTGRASHWSEPVEFVPGFPDVNLYRSSLVVSEVMYNPSTGSQHEFIELHNVGGSSVDLTGIRFTKGIDYDFPDGTSIPADGYLLVVKDLAAFEAEHGGGLPIAGVWEAGDSLNNGGENVKLSFGAGTVVHEFNYLNVPPWPTAANGGGYSLTLGCDHEDVDHTDPLNWRASVAVGGSPGVGDGLGLPDWLIGNGLSPGDEWSDFDLDGLTALIEYGVGGDPAVADVESVRSLEFGTEVFLFSFHRDRTADGVRVIAEFSSDLLGWSPAEVIDIDIGVGTIDTIVVRPPVGVVDGYFRLRAEKR